MPLNFREEFNAKGVRCEVIHGGMSDVERKGFLFQFERGKIKSYQTVRSLQKALMLHTLLRF